MCSTIHVADHEIEYDVLNRDRKGPWLVFLHEGLGGIDLWRSLLAGIAAAAGRPVLVCSRHGYGFSEVLTQPRSVDFMHHEAPEMLPELLTSLGIDIPILVVIPTGYQSPSSMPEGTLSSDQPSRINRPRTHTASDRRRGSQDCSRYQ